MPLATKEKKIFLNLNVDLTFEKFHWNSVINSWNGMSLAGEGGPYTSYFLLLRQSSLIMHARMLSQDWKSSGQCTELSDLATKKKKLKIVLMSLSFLICLFITSMFLHGWNLLANQGLTLHIKQEWCNLKISMYTESKAKIVYNALKLIHAFKQNYNSRCLWKYVTL